MSDLKSLDKRKLEKYLEMRSGYVCDFTNISFEDFIYENTSINIYTDKYTKHTGSKANRLRAFWEKESNDLVATLLEELLEYWKFQSKDSDPALYDECKKIVEKLKSSSPIESVDMLNPDSSEKDINLLFESIKDSIKKNQPEQALDRLHTYLTKYIRIICDRHSISYKQDTPIHSLFGSYIKFLRQEGFIESDMSEKILKSSISILEAFNKVRNNQSFAHDNPLLSYDESVLIFNNISSTMNFVKLIEVKISEEDKLRDNEIEEAEELYIQYELDRMRGK